ncbi:hypothetical protein JW960_14195 [candidate division KSB1 bacterium]|nr:hypothetical protein [candidate division KSB1 bacterium]
MNDLISKQIIMNDEHRFESELSALRTSIDKLSLCKQEPPDRHFRDIILESFSIINQITRQYPLHELNDFITIINDIADDIYHNRIELIPELINTIVSGLDHIHFTLEARIVKGL